MHIWQDVTKVKSIRTVVVWMKAEDQVVMWHLTL